MFLIRLVDLFSTPWDSDPSFISLKKALITYHSLLKSTHLTNATLSSLPLPTRKDVASAHNQLPSRFSTVLPLLLETIAVLIRLPFFFVPLIIHIPIYYTTRWIGNKSAHEEESMAQNKVVVGLLMLFAIYGFWFCMIWMLFWMTPIGAIVAASTMWLLAFYHGKLIDDNYIR
jgi:glycerol-3-phosphate O-acyltransferase / dihydroxyacetone phosphate acyltransferase